MSFCKNTVQQMNMFDPIYQLTEREKKRLQNSWAEKFSKDIFPKINEERFSVSNFRTAVYRYYEEHGVDLIQEEVESLSKEFCDFLNIDGRTIRMDSLMISSSCKKLSRLEIIYSCVSRLIKEIEKNGGIELPEHLKAYLEEEHHNDTIYRCKDKDIETKLNNVTADAIELYYICLGREIEDSEEFKVLRRMIGEQTQKKDKKIELKPSKEISPQSLQNPTDPDATYRKKGKKDYVGYVANIAESFNDESSIITQYDLKQNIYSDQSFSNDFIEKTGKQEETVRVVVDGAYFSDDINNKAQMNNIELIPTNMTGREVSADKEGYEDFVINETEHAVEKCPMGNVPTDSTYRDGVYRAHFEREKCKNCPKRCNCAVIEQKKQFLLQVSEKTIHREKLKSKMENIEYKELARKRAGVEGIPSVLRRRYGIDQLPVRGKVRSKIWLGLKIAAINCKRYIKRMLERLKNLFYLEFLTHLLGLKELRILFFQNNFVSKRKLKIESLLIGR